MSGEVEKNKDEEKNGEKNGETKEEPKKPIRYRILEQWQLGFKLLELVIAAACMGFIYEPMERTGMCNTRLHHVGILYTTYTGCMVIILGFIIGKVLKEKLGYRTSFVFSIVNAALFLASGILLTADKADLTKDHFFHPARYLLNMMTFSIILTFINVLVFVVDAIITFKRQQDF